MPGPRLVTTSRGGTSSDADHHLLAVWVADCTEYVLHYFEQVRQATRPRAIELACAWARGEITMTPARRHAGRDLFSSTREAAHAAAGRAGAVAHVAAHELGGAA